MYPSAFRRQTVQTSLGFTRGARPNGVNEILIRTLKRIAGDEP